MDIYLPPKAKPLEWLGSSQADVRAFPAEARLRAGRALRALQEGSMPVDWKPMAAVGTGVQEIRIRVGRDFRILYVAKYAEAIYVLHAFEKKTRKTRRAEIAVARWRLASIGRTR